MSWLLLKHKYIHSSNHGKGWIRVSELLNNVFLFFFFQPGLALLTLFLSRVEVIKQTIATSSDVVDTPSLEESQWWYALEILTS